MTEPDVAFTDYGIAILCGYFVWCILKIDNKNNRLKKLWTLFFSSIAIASFTGGTVHGFFLNELTLGYRILWPTTLLAIGMMATIIWHLVGQIYNQKKNKIWSLLANFLFLIYAAVIMFYSQTFKVVIVNYLPPVILLLILTMYRYFQTQFNYFLIITGGVLLSLIAALAQQAGVSIHEIYFNYNATYHLIQFFGLWVLFVGVQQMIIYEGKNQ